jgi:hypothetical protein
MQYSTVYYGIKILKNTTFFIVVGIGATQLLYLPHREKKRGTGGGHYHCVEPSPTTKKCL